MHTPYFGNDLTVADCEMLALSRVAAPLRVAESLLFTRKWHDYRSLHPVQATYLFAEQYRLAVRRAYAKQKDIRTLDKVKWVDVEGLFVSREFTAGWRDHLASLANCCSD